MPSAAIAELAFIALSYALFTFVLVGTIMVLAILRRLRIERIEGRHVPLIAAHRSPRRSERADEESTVLFDDRQGRTTGVTRVVLHPRQNASS